MSNETEKKCLRGMIDYVKNNIRHEEEQIEKLRKTFGHVSNRDSGANTEIAKHQGMIMRFQNVLKILEFDEASGLDHVHIDKDYVPEIEYDDKPVTFADMD